MTRNIKPSMNDEERNEFVIKLSYFADRWLCQLSLDGHWQVRIKQFQVISHAWQLLDTVVIIYKRIWRFYCQNER